MKKIVLIILMLFCYFSRYSFSLLDEFKSKTIYIEIKGEVKDSGSYKLNYNQTINDAIKKANGLLDTADISSINLNQTLHDKDVIVIKKKESKEKISINSADLETLCNLNGIGVATAQKIINYRIENGSFQTIEDIMNVKGIKEKLFEKIKDDICL